MQQLKQTYTIKTFDVGPMLNMIYLIWDKKTKEAALVDPAWDLSHVLDFIRNNSLNLKKILLTHSHHDHVNSVDKILSHHDIPVYINKIEASFWGKKYDNLTGLDSEENIYLGHARLSILDISSKGNQPMISKSKRFVITFNGEIYNFKELKSNKFEIIYLVGQDNLEFDKKDEFSIVKNAEYTPCTKENYLIKNCPGWKLKSKKIYHDSEKKTIHYDHAQLQLFNIPVFYLPYFSHPDPSVKKRSGFLMPTIQTDNQLGETFSIPIFLNLSSNRDLTFTPNIQTTGNNFYNLDYRHLNNSFNLEINSSIDDNDDNTGTSNHLFIESEIFNSYGNLNTYLKTSNNDTYMRKNKINNLTVLKSGFEFDREEKDTYFSIEAIGYKHLTCLLYTSPSPRDRQKSRMPSSA